MLAKPAAERRRIIVTGDFNEFEFVSPVKMIASAGLTILTRCNPRTERYTMAFLGNALALDHFLVGSDLQRSARVQIVHMNVEFKDSPSDHEPVVAVFNV